MKTTVYVLQDGNVDVVKGQKISVENNQGNHIGETMAMCSSKKDAEEWSVELCGFEEERTIIEALINYDDLVGMANAMTHGDTYFPRLEVVSSKVINILNHNK